ncbi:TIGR04282 family arsenosugar biosynthesis glycosyltransferase [Chlorobium sp. KB01]|uniref:TIGR04282 family arsenosugar biosynthesis glycosyltransferase n=1 Tax=Chlorobium sp. KB01 TaxID=1917528 RepID=UPI000977BE51|nr:TIGR04282 family arsenosugar biosynthesis glycosyltransferase [Chlorobium sp. KB01]
MHANKLLIIFSRNPVAGKVKTRLSAAIGDEKALEIYESLRSQTARVTMPVNAKKEIWFSNFIPAEDLLLTKETTARLQQGKDLGERMHHALSSGFKTGARRIVLIGTDCHEMSAEIIEEAFSALEHSETVIGPARDGGFYLIGMKKAIPELFLEREWSIPDVLQESVDILLRLNISFKQLRELSDIDTLEDLKNSSLWPPCP